MAISQEDNEFLLMEFIPEFRSRISWLFARKEIGGVFPVFLVLYSHRRKLPLPFVDYDDMEYERGNDELQDRLYDAADAFVGGSDEAYGKLVSLDDYLDTLSRKMFMECYPALVRNTLRLTDLAEGTAMMPNYRIAYTIAKILREHGCESVYTMMSGVGQFSAACKGLDFVGAEPSAPAILISEVMDDAYGIRKSKYRNINPLEKWPRKISDAVICNLPVDAEFFNEYRFQMEWQFNKDLESFFNRSLDSRRARKVVAGIIHFNLANYGEFDSLRKRLCEEGVLETVIALPEKIFREAEVPTYIVVLDMEGGRSEATFIRATESMKRQSPLYGDEYDVREAARENDRITVPYSEMEKVDWVFNPAVYLQNAECREGMELVRLGDLVTVPKLGLSKGGRNIPWSFFSERFEKVAAGVTPEASVDDHDNLCVEGPSLLVSLTEGRRNTDQKLRCAICKENGRYSVHPFTMIFQPDPDRISLEYLALALMQDPTFVRYYKDIQAYYVDDIRYKSMLARKIPVLTDLSEQRKAVADALGRADMADHIYNVILAGAGSKAGRLGSILAKNGLNVQAVSDSVEGAGGLEELLRNGTGKNVPVSRRIDAVIFSTDIRLSQGGKNDNYEGLDAVIDLQLLFDREGVSFFAFSDSSLDDICLTGLFSSRRMRHLRSGHFYCNPEGGGLSAALCPALREELDARNSILPRIRTRYREAFEAAEWLDSAYPDKEIHSADILSDFLVASETGSVDTNRKISDLRNVAHRIIEILRECRAVPTDLDNGAVPHLLYDGKYSNDRAGKTYTQRVGIMPRHLSASLVSLIEIGNVGTHTYKENPRLSKIMMDALLEFVVWFHSNRELFAKRLSGYWSEGNKNEEIFVDIVGKAECHVDNGRTYWLCAGIHLFVDKKAKPALKEGDRVIIRCIKNDTTNPAIPGVDKIAFPRSAKFPDGYVIEADSVK